MLSKTFTKKFSVYRKKYIYQRNSLFDFDDYYSSLWQTSENYLTDSMIEKALLGLKVYGYFLASCPNMFGIDIDDHTGKGSGYLLSLLDKVENKLNNLPPSVLCKSPHGLHAYYFLEYPIVYSVLETKLSDLFKDIPVEIKPTNRTGIRIPNIKNFLNPETLLPLKNTFENIISSAKVYHPYILFNDIDPNSIRNSLKDRKRKTLRLQESKRIAKIEAVFPCIYGGNTNEALTALVPVYRTAGLSIEEAAERFSTYLAPVYDGELRNYKRLIVRIKSFYRNDSKLYKKIITPENKQLDFYSEILACNLADKVTGKTETRQQKAALTVKKRTIKRTVLKIEIWKNYIDEIKNNKPVCEYWNYLYPFFKKNTKEGYYPLPQSLLKEIHSRYNEEVLPFLIEHKYLEKSPYGYSAGFGTCLHYKINQQIQ